MKAEDWHSNSSYIRARQPKWNSKPMVVSGKSYINLTAEVPDEYASCHVRVTHHYLRCKCAKTQITNFRFEEAVDFANWILSLQDEQETT